MGEHQHLPFVGMLFRDWFRILKEAGWNGTRWDAALKITARSLFNELLRVEEERQLAEKIRHHQPAPPLFILGLPRSGTTLLHELLSHDPRLVSPNLVQVCHPHTFFLLEKRLAGPVARCLRMAQGLWVLLTGRSRELELGSRRGLDNIPVTLSSPQEDESAMWTMGRSCNLELNLPSLYPRYRRWIGLQDEAVREDWTNSWLRFIKRVSYFHAGKSLVLKSAYHTARVGSLLKAFPRAKFVFISRHPVEIYQSMSAALKFVTQFPTLEGTSEAPRPVNQEAISLLQTLIEGYMSQRDSIPPDQHCVVRYKELTTTPTETLHKIYEHLDMPDFDPYRAEFERAVRDRSEYVKNVHPPLSEQEEELLRRTWAPYYDAFDY